MSAGTALREQRLRVEAATPAGIEPFGRLLASNAGAPRMDLGYYAGAVFTSRPVDFSCDSTTDISLASLRPRPLQVRYLERHFQHTQTFIPLGGKPWLAVLAPAGHDEMPDLAAARAFRFAGDTGLCLHRGTWHEFPFPVEDGTDMIVILSSQTTEDLRHRATNGIEAFGPDLDKKDITLRAGVVLTLDL